MSVTVGDDGEEPGRPDGAAAIRPRGEAIELLRPRPRRDVVSDSNGLYILGLRVSLLDLRLTGDAGAILL